MSFILRVILALILILIMEYYFFKRCSNSIKQLSPKFTFDRVKKWILISVLIINIYPAYLLIVWAYSAISQTGRPHLPESRLFDWFILFPFWISSLIIMQSIVIFLIADIVKLLLLPFYKRYKDKWLPVLSKIYLVIIAASIIYVPVRIFYDFYNVSVRIVEYDANHASPGNFTIAFISDIQADKYTNSKRLQNFVDKVNETNPDLVLIAGDIITSTPDYIDLAAEYLGRIKAKHGVYTCIGDHDNWAYRNDQKRSINEITEALANVNVQMIDNENLVLDADGFSIGISFITYTYAQRIRAEMVDSLTAALPDVDLKILLSHQPAKLLIVEALEQNYDLFLAGHTHGGQISFLFPFINLSPTLIETKYVKGDFDINGMKMIITRGLGMSLVPIRYNSTPEVTVIKIH